MPNNLNNIIYLTQEQYNTLTTNGTITVEGKTVLYDVNNVYMVAEEELKLPTTVNNKYLHTNSSTGDLEWSDASVSDVKINNSSVVSNNIATIPIASTSSYGVVKLGSDTTQIRSIQSPSQTIGRTYPVQFGLTGTSDEGKMCVNVPWTDTTYTSQSASQGGTSVSLVTTGEKYTWNNKQNEINVIYVS